MHYLEHFGYFRTAIASPELKVADVDFNVRSHIACIEKAVAESVRLLVFPELSITAYTCADLFYQKALLVAARAGLSRLAEVTSYESIAIIVGFPLEVEGRIYNCAVLASGGDVLGIVPKIHLPTTHEFYEKRWFASGHGVVGREWVMGNRKVPFGTDLIFQSLNVEDCRIGIEICEDLWAVQPPSGDLALAGATVIANPSASNELLGKATYRRDLVKQQSARCHAVYLYTSSGSGESTTDVVYSGHGIVAENGQVLTELPRFELESTITTVDVDCARMQAERSMNATFRDCSAIGQYRKIDFKLADNDRMVKGINISLLRPNPAHPFIPADMSARESVCAEIFAIQSMGLVKRIQSVNTKKVVIGVSGGLDSTLALLVIVQAFDKLKLSRSGIIAVTMPGFGTTDRTRGNALKMAELLGVTVRTIPIDTAVLQHFADIGHDPQVFDITYENAQARERTQILMNVANQTGGFVVGTGDLSELALGWCTFNGDHISMYHVNIGVPKTLVRYIIAGCADKFFCREAEAVLRDICETPVSPELLPLGDRGELVQETEKTVGPYELHDFFLYYTLRACFAPAKIFYLAQKAFEKDYTSEAVLKWLEVFYRRFFSQQFKRSTMSDGPKVGTVALSPRGDWRMPSDASANVWLEEIERLKLKKLS